MCKSRDSDAGVAMGHGELCRESETGSARHVASICLPPTRKRGAFSVQGWRPSAAFAFEDGSVAKDHGQLDQ